MKSRKEQITIAWRKQYLLHLKQPIACLKPNYKSKLPDEFPEVNILAQAYELCQKWLNLNILLPLNKKYSPKWKKLHTYSQKFGGF